MLGWFRAEAARASRRNRSSACGSLATSSGRNFSATKRPRSVSSACTPPPCRRRPASRSPGSGRWFGQSQRWALLCYERRMVGPLAERVNAKSAGRTFRAFDSGRLYTRSPTFGQTKGRPERRQWAAGRKSKLPKAHWRPESRLIPGTPCIGWIQERGGICSNTVSFGNWLPSRVEAKK
jgi:hypothetical protein